MGLFRNRKTRNGRYLCSFGSYSVFGMNEYHSVHSAPDSRMNRMEEYGLLGIERIRILLGNFWREILCGRPQRSRSRDIAVLRSPRIPFPDLRHVGAFFSKLKFCVFCYS